MVQQPTKFALSNFSPRIFGLPSQNFGEQNYQQFKGLEDNKKTTDLINTSKKEVNLIVTQKSPSKKMRSEKCKRRQNNIKRKME